MSPPRPCRRNRLPGSPVPGASGTEVITLDRGDLCRKIHEQHVAWRRGPVSPSAIHHETVFAAAGGLIVERQGSRCSAGSANAGPGCRFSNMEPVSRELWDAVSGNPGLTLFGGAYLSAARTPLTQGLSAQVGRIGSHRAASKKSAGRCSRGRDRQSGDREAKVLMPHAAPHPCAYPGCSTLTDGRRCQGHRRQEFGFTNPILLDGENGAIAGLVHSYEIRKLAVAKIKALASYPEGFQFTGA